MKNIFNLERLYRFTLVGVLAFLVVVPALAQEAGQGEDDEQVLTPNMTVNIKLNSALSDKETEFYSKIAQDIISRIPREVALDKQLSRLKEINSKHEHVNIVSYLPPTGDVNTDKLIQHFKVKFIFADDEGAQTPEEATISAETVGLKKPIEPAPEPAEPKVPATEPEEKVVKDVTTEPEPVAQKPAKKKQKIAKATPQKDFPDLQIEFRADETDLSLAQRKQLMNLVNTVRARGVNQPKGYTFVVRSYNGPTGENTWLAEERLRSVTALLRQQDVNLARTNVTEIFVHTNKDQFVEIMPVN